MPNRPLISGLLLAVLALSLHHPLLAQQKKLTFTDLMQLRTIQQPSISDDGAWVALTAQPDRGDGEVIVHATRGETRYVVPLGSHPVISADGAWVAMRHNPALAEVEESAEDDRPKRGLALLNTADGATEHLDAVQDFAFSADGAWIAYHAFEDTAADTAADTAGTDEGGKRGKRKPGTRLVLRALATGQEVEVPFVRTFAFDEAGRYLAYAVAGPDTTAAGLSVRDLRAAGAPAQALDERPSGHYSALTWNEATGHLAFLAATEDADGEPGTAALWTWDGNAAAEVVAAAPEGWTLPADQSIRWTDDGARLFFGYRPAPAGEAAEDQEDEKGEETPFDPYDVDAILADRTVDVWHWNDSLINPQQKKQWSQSRGWTYDAVYDRASNRAVTLADRDVRGSGTPENERFMLARSTTPYLKSLTWEGSFFDAYLVDLSDGSRTRIAERLSSTLGLSPEGRYAVYYDDRAWHLFEAETGATRNLTAALGVPFADEDWDYPAEVPGYGVAGWMAGDAAVLIYDKYDIWYLPTDGGAATNLTSGAGRAEDRTFRIIRTDPDRDAFEPGQDVLLSSFHNHRKNDGFYRLRLDPRKAGAHRLLEEEKRFRFLAKAEEADVYLYTREDYDEFPDLWVADPAFKDSRKVTDVNPRMDEFAWGTSELVEWHSVDGIPLQGVVIKPGNYDPGRRYPVLVYFYRFMSDRLHAFNEPAVNHRPSFPVYASDDYIAFCPMSSTSGPGTSMARR
jgi:dipeptidyl aminopeptidase/acylaminoacyl peptidase